MKKSKKKNDESTAPSIKINRRRRSGKKRVDLFARLRNTEHPLDNIITNTQAEPVAENTQAEPVVGIASQPSQPIQPHTTQPEISQKPTVPTKDYQKVPNSITRDAVPSRFFKGTSKVTYDSLYLKTRGAVIPVRTIKATKRELMKWTSTSHVTIFKHLKHLESVGLIKIEQQLGSHDGSIYEVFIPEELTSEQSENDPYNPILSYPILSHPIPYQKVVWDPYYKVVLDRMGNPIENKDTYGIPKTSFKDYKNDDEAFAAMIEVLTKMSEKVNGKSPHKNQTENWQELAEILVMELEIAAARTDTISNVPAFLTEHLRRRLLHKPEDVSQPTTNAKDKKGISRTKQVGKPDKPVVGIDEQNYEAEPLTEEGRKTVLKTMREYIERGQQEFVMSFEGTYTKEDWKWLSKNLKEMKLSESDNENSN